MNENYAVINGKRVELTDEQVKALGIKRKNPFERVAKYDAYYTVLSSGSVGYMEDYLDCQDDSQYDAANYFNDKAFAEQVALHQLLYRKLLKFAYDNEAEDREEWNGENAHWCIRYNNNRKKFDSYCQNGYKAQGVYFSSEDAAKHAIEEVVKPFMEEHPNFVW